MKNSLDMDFITKNLPLLTSLTLTYGMKNIGTDELFPKDKKGVYSYNFLFNLYIDIEFYTIKFRNSTDKIWVLNYQKLLIWEKPLKILLI